MSEQDSSKQQSRRGFLISSAAAAALAAAASVTGAAPAPATSKPSSKPAGGRMSREERQKQQAAKPVATTKSKYNQINVAFIGIEGQGGANLRGMAEAGANVYALCDIDSEKRDRRKAAKAGRPLPEKPDAATYRVAAAARTPLPFERPAELR